MSDEAWAIVGATLLGPVFAVLVTIWRQNADTKYARRLHVFRTLMATRRMSISGEHVGALNLVEVDFYGHRKVQDAWRVYKEHLFDDSKPEDDPWREKKEKLLASMLHAMAQVLGFDIPALDLFKGGYAPVGWAHRDLRVLGAMEFIHQLSTGEKVVPMYVVNMPKNEGTSDVPTSPKNP